MKQVNSSTSLKAYFLKSQIWLSTLTLLICLIGLSTIATLTFKKYAEYNLRLISQSLTEQLQAAVVFNDHQAVTEITRSFLDNYPLASISVYQADLQLISAEFSTTEQIPQRYIQKLYQLIVSDSVIQREIKHNNQIIAHVYITNSMTPLLDFLKLFFLVFFLCIIISIIIVWSSTHLIYKRINQSLVRLTSTTERITEQRAFQLRAPSSKIEEFNKISRRFNKLLEEIQSWESHLQEQNLHLEHRTLHDTLTHLPNRAYFNKQLNLLFTPRETRSNFALLFIDNNNFKYINDTYGHLVGDAVLLEMSYRLKDALRSTDFIARLGGDEFAILLPNILDASQAIVVAKNLIETTQTPLKLDNGAFVHFSFSVGIAMAAEVNSTTELLYLADQAMYKAKETTSHWAIMHPPHSP